MSDELDKLQNPAPEEKPDNLSVINQFNHADSNRRNAINEFNAGQSAEYDDKLNRMHGIDARLMTELAPVERFDPGVMHQIKMYQALGQIPMAYDLMDQENRKILARDQMGGAMTPEEWERMRDYAGKKAAARGSVATEMNSGPIKQNGDMMQVRQIQMAQASPDLKDWLYQQGVNSFDRVLGKHKKYLVQYPQVPLAYPPVQSSTPVQAAPPVQQNPILAMMLNAQKVGQQQLAGSPPVDEQTFAKLLGKR